MDLELLDQVEADLKLEFEAELITRNRKELHI